MSAKLFVEGAAQGPDSKLLQSRCREAFRKLFEKCGLAGRLPQIAACGGRGTAFRDFATAHKNAQGGKYVAMLVDSEEPIIEIDKPWEHLKQRDGWDKPETATDEQVLLMTTCMETWIAADRPTLREHYGAALQVNALPSLHDIESRGRHAVQDALQHATRDCKNKYEKGKRSFEILGKLNVVELRTHLPSFERCERILNAKL